jgi:Protein of unknown function (DUF3108)
VSPRVVSARARGGWAVLGPLLFYTAAAVVLTWPLVASLRSHLGAPEGPGDPYLNLWILGWDLRTMATHPAWLFNGRIFDANIFHPATGTLTYSDHLIPQALLVLPLYLLSGDPVLCYNVLLFGSFVASGLAMHALARSLGASFTGASVAGIAWAFWPYRVAHLIHLQLQALYFLPLALLFLLRVVAAGRRRDAIWLGVTAGLQAASSLYYGVMTAIALVVTFAGVAAGVGRMRNGRLLGRAALAAVVALIVLAPVVWPYWRMQQDEGFARNLYEASRHEAVLTSFLQVPPTNVIYGSTHLLTERDSAGALREGRHEGVEDELFPGALLMLLAALGLVASRREATAPVAWTMLALAGVGLVLSLGPDGIRPIYAFFHRVVFGFQAVRAPARFAVLVMFGLAVLASRGATALTERTGRPVVGAALLLILCLEYASMPWPMVVRPPLRTEVGQWLASVSGPGAVVYLPVANDRRDTVPMVDSLQYSRPLVNGASGQRPSFYPALVDTMSTFPSAESLWMMHDLDVRFIVAPTALASAPSSDALRRGILPLGDTPLVERARFADAVIYELTWSPEVESRLVLPAPPAPPPPGPVPFAVGERLTYDVRWVGGPMDLPAGRAVVGVEAGPSADQPFRFVATAETAPWVSRFFEAKDRFETLASADLLPTVHRRDLLEGRRALTREAVFDRGSGVVRIGAPGDPGAMSFRLSPGTRDILTAFFYLRTLPLHPGDSVVVPVTDGGRAYTVTVRTVGRETVMISGRPVNALRVEPLVSERVPRRAPVDVVVWLTPDALHRVLAADLAAGFGRVRLELTGER